MKQMKVKRSFGTFPILVLVSLTWICFISLTLNTDSPPHERNDTSKDSNQGGEFPSTKPTLFLPQETTISPSQLNSDTNLQNLSVTTNQMPKVILLWTQFYSKPWNFPEGNRIFKKLSCPVKMCVITDNKTQIHKSDVVLFHMRDISAYSQLPSYRNPQQHWIFYTLESPYHTETNLSQFDGVFNWTSTYSSKSDIPTPYGHYTAFKNVDNKSSVQSLSKLYPGKTRPIAWFVTNCKSQNKRMEYALELQKYIPVDIYGSCGNFKCKNQELCLNMLREKYKFYLAFENSNCAEYITEKFWFNALQHDIVPIVMGAPRSHYQRLAPPFSFIHVDDFPSVHALARYLRMLMKNDVLYNEFFRWKTMGRVHTEINLQTAESMYWCKLCKALHDPEVSYKTHSNIEKWWSVQNQCYS